MSDETNAFFSPARQAAINLKSVSTEAARIDELLRKIPDACGFVETANRVAATPSLPPRGPVSAPAMIHFHESNTDQSTSDP
ncbi:hypothetical protein ACVBGC_03725 [Burkholderia stagnalis]